MNICLPDTYLLNDVFRCLFADLKVPFTRAPKSGKYTAQIGACYCDEALCDGLQGVLGSLVECHYLGADTALVFAPCGECSGAQIQTKLSACLRKQSAI